MYRGLLGGLANKGDLTHSHNCVIVELKSGRSKSIKAGATFIVAVTDLPADGEFLVY